MCICVCMCVHVCNIYIYIYVCIYRVLVVDVGVELKVVCNVVLFVHDVHAKRPMHFIFACAQVPL